MQQSGQSPDRLKDIEAELKRLRAKASEVDDKDIKSALQLKIDALETERVSAGAPSAAEPEPEVLPSPPTPEQQADADKLVAQARVEKMRGNGERASELLRQAVSVAPGSSTVVELLADELVGQRKYREALDKYDLARRLDPKNAGADKKHADLVFQTRAHAASANLMIAEQASLATSSKIATMFACLLPGSGQLVMQRYALGAFYMVTWILMIVWLGVMKSDFAGVLILIGLHVRGAKADFSPVVFIPISVAALIHIAGIVGTKSGSSREAAFMAHMTKADRPTPPVNLPFE